MISNEDQPSAFLKKLEGEGYELSKVVMLPVAVEQYDIKAVDRVKASSSSVFGGSKEHTYQKSRIDYKFNVHYLYIGNNPPESLNRIDGNKIQIFIKGNDRTIAEVKGNFENLKSLTAITSNNALEDIAELKVSDVNLTKEQKIGIRDQVVNYLK